IVHITNSVLLFVFFKHFFKRSYAFVLSLLFLIHPINVEAVVYIAAFSNSLFFLFGIFALVLCINKITYRKGFISILLLLLFSLLTNETGMLFVFLTTFFVFLFKKEKLNKFLIGIFLVLIAYGLLRFFSSLDYHKEYLYPIEQLSIDQRFMTMPAVIFYYLKSLIYPIELAANQQWVVTNLSMMQFYKPLIFDLLFFSPFIMLGIFLYRNNKKNTTVFLFFLFWFLAGLLFHIQLIPLNLTVADHWFYFPFVGLLGLLGLGWFEMEKKVSFIKKINLLLIITLITILSLLTIIRNSNWQNSISLFMHDQVYSDNFEIQNFLGIEYLNQKDYSNAAMHFQESLKISPNLFNIFNLASVYSVTGKFADEKKLYLLAIKSNDPYVRQKGYEQLSFFLFVHESNKEATDFVEKAVNIYPLDGLLWANSAIGNYKLHNQQKALYSAKRAYSLMPNQKTSVLVNQIANKKTLKFE
ncbi:MAG: tetratricopeptide repeat protein, partial [Candidatus Levyibacteriota bacterium]